MEIIEILKKVIHPEQNRDIVSMGMVENITQSSDKVSFTIRLTKPRDPMASSIKRTAEALIKEATGITPIILIAEPQPTPKRAVVKREPKKITHTIAIASGKGGVGKSTITANLAVALARAGKRVGIIDADIYGPSMPKMFGVEEYQPITMEESEMIEPAENYGVKIMSIGFFVSTKDALVWRGPMATNALKQLIHQTAWGELDFLLIDLPPGTGDIHLSVVAELKIDSAIIVTTPQKVALLDVARGISMFRNEHINIPIMGIVNNMAYFTPSELPNNRYYIFGKSDAAEQVARENNTEILEQIPLIQSIAESGDAGKPIAMESVTFDSLAAKVIASSVYK